MGFTVGCNDGLFEGETVGILVGRNVGLVGAKVGLYVLEGRKVGFLVGFGEVGLAVGEMVGELVGKSVGSGDGTKEGSGEGAGVGSADGSITMYTHV